MNPTPTSNSESLKLSHPTPTQWLEISRLSAAEWKESISVPQFIEESSFLTTAPLARNGGGSQRCLLLNHHTIVSSCETFKKRVLLSDGKGEVEERIVVGIASVFTPEEERGKGYAGKMLGLLAGVLREGGKGTEEEVVGSVLYSDIGKRYYTRLGWKAIPNNSHLEFTISGSGGLGTETFSSSGFNIKMLKTEDLENLCLEDEKIVKERMAGYEDGKKRMIIIPDLNHMLWHHAKEDFVSNKLFGKQPQFRGILIGTPGERIWAIWTHRWYESPHQLPSSNTLYILRLVIENPNMEKEKLRGALGVVVQAASEEAREWGLGSVKIWDPAPFVEKAFEGLDINSGKVEREEESIASLFWFGEEGEEPEWIENEKYAWC